MDIYEMIIMNNRNKRVHTARSTHYIVLTTTTTFAICNDIHRHDCILISFVTTNTLEYLDI